MRARRTAQLLYYHRPRQFAWRLWRQLQLRGERLAARGGFSSVVSPRAVDGIGLAPGAADELRRLAERRVALWPARRDARYLDDLASGRFTFLKVTHDLSNAGAPSSPLSRERGDDADTGHRISDTGSRLPSIDWHPRPGVPRLWRFHLQCQEYLLPLAIDRDAAAAWRLVRSWLSEPRHARPHLEPDGWHPFCISRRLPVWMMLAAICPPPADSEAAFWRSIAAQVDWLARHLERDLGGNHLLENYRALVLASCYLQPAARQSRGFGGRRPEAGARQQNSEYPIPDVGYRRWVRPVLKELRQQVLPSGEHFERTPTYHAIMLLAVLEIAEAWEFGDSKSGDPGAGGREPEQYRLAAQASASRDRAPDTGRGIPDTGYREVAWATACRMAAFLQSILHPDGQIPLLADSVLGETPDPRLLCRDGLNGGRKREDNGDPVAGSWGREYGRGGHATAKGGEGLAIRPTAEGDRPPASAGLAGIEGDYWTWRSDAGDFLLFDHGPLACDHLPAHGHADLLTIEASVAGRRLFVDAGTYDYEDSAMRAYCRSSEAHNTLVLGKAGANGDSVYVDHADLWSRFRMGRRGRPVWLKRGECGDFHWCAAAHSAYRQLGVPWTGRLVAAADGPVWVIVDFVGRSQGHPMTSFLNVHPEVRVSQSSERQATLEVDSRRYSMTLFGDAQLTVRSGWYCSDFGIRDACNRLVGSSTGAGWIGWVLTKCGEGESSQLRVERCAGNIGVRLSQGPKLGLLTSTFSLNIPCK